MTLAELQAAVQQMSGISDAARLRSAIQLAAREVWDSIDLPGALQEIRVVSNAERYVTFPWQVYKVRAAHSAYDKMPMDLNTIHPAYHDYNWHQSNFECRIIRRVPLRQAITNASTLRFKLRKVESADLTINIVGTTDLASRVSEPVTIPAGQLMAESEERYIGILDALTKSRVTNSDIDVLDANGTNIGVFPNHLSECYYVLAQMRDRCSYESAYSDVFDVLFKPHPPALAAEADSFPPPYDQTVMYKALEQLNFRTAETIPVAEAFNSKSNSVLHSFAADDNRGKTLKANIKANPFVTHYGGRL